MKSSNKKYSLCILLLIPVILAITECLLWFTSTYEENGENPELVLYKKR